MIAFLPCVLPFRLVSTCVPTGISNWIPLDLYTKLHEKKKKKSNFINGVFQFPEATSEGQPFLFLEVMSNIFFFSWNTRMQQRDCSSMRGEK